jgi:hypothetical protein
MRLALRIAVCAAGFAVVGCGFAEKPYTNDPLLRGGRAVWLSRDAIPPQPPQDAPKIPAIVPPQPPATSRLE